jgi:predicted lactoylglutathione lyase
MAATSYGIHTAYFKMTFKHLIQSSDSICIILLTGELYNITIIVNVVTLLLQNKSFKEFGQDLIGSEKFANATICLLCQDFGNEVGSYLFGLGGKNTKWELAKFFEIDGARVNECMSRFL